MTTDDLVQLLWLEHSNPITYAETNPETEQK